MSEASPTTAARVMIALTRALSLAVVHLRFMYPPPVAGCDGHGNEQPRAARAPSAPHPRIICAVRLLFRFIVLLDKAATPVPRTVTRGEVPKVQPPIATHSPPSRGSDRL